MSVSGQRRIGVGLGITSFLKCLSQDVTGCRGENHTHHMETEEDIGGSCIEGDHHVSAAMCQIGIGQLYPVLQLLMTYPLR